LELIPIAQGKNSLGQLLERCAKTMSAGVFKTSPACKFYEKSSPLINATKTNETSITTIPTLLFSDCGLLKANECASK